MLIYNSAKEFIGIDENDLKTLGLSNLSQLRSEAADFADLFVRTPGHVHNFQHVHWIDFVSCAESIEESKVIISIESRSYSANLDITKAYLSDNPISEAYFIHLNNLRVLTAQEKDSISSEIIPKTAPIAVIEEKEYKEAKVEVKVKDKVLTKIEEEIAETPIEIPIELPSDEPEVSQIIEPAINIEEEDDYVFDPHVASSELGLPVDLIEEFIQDFIAQADEFKSKLYTSLEEKDIINIAILSHKLKGVAANLRIENALNAISDVNASKDTAIIKTNLDLFYNIMDKLAGKDVSIKPSTIEPKILDKDEEFVLEFKDNVEDAEEILEKTESIEETIENDDFILEFKDDELEETNIVEEVKEVKEDIEVYYSKELSANAIGLDMETFEELFVDYVSDSRDTSSHIHQALSQNDFDKCIKEARILKGMSDSMQMKDFSKELECLMSSSDKKEMTKAIEKIDNVIEQISKKVK